MESPTRLRHKHSSNTCGCFCWKWPLLQRLCHVNAFMIVFSGLFIISLSIAGYLAGVLSTVEKRFQLKSAEVGAISTVSSAVSLSLVVFLSYYGQNQHRPRWIAIGGVFVGVGSILMSFPQFVYDTPPFLLDDASSIANTTLTDGGIQNNQSTELCQKSDNSSLNYDYNVSCEDDEELSTSSYGVAWLITGQVLIGIGSSAFLPLAITFIDDNVPKTSTPLYVGILFGSSGIAPLIGFGLSSVCLSYYSDFNTLRDITPDDPNWLGAWWLGFFIYGLTTLILAVPMFMFPKRISEQEDHNSREDGIQAVSNGRHSDNVADMLDLTSVVYRPTSVPNPDAETVKCGVVKGFLIALRRIITNPAFVIVVLGVCLVFAAMSGFLTFGAKYIETQYGVSASLSPLILGGMVAPGGILGNFLGGYIVKRLQLNALQCSKMILCIALPMTIISPCLYFFGCNNPAIAGLTVDYGSVENTDMTYYGNMSYNDIPSVSSSPLTSQCNAHCQCESVYSPVCGSDGVTYMSPCYAGCSESSVDDDNNTIFQRCGCISQTTEPADDVQSLAHAQKGECQRQCDNLWVFAGVFMVVFLFSCIWSNPAFMLYLRVVEPKDRAIAVGFASLALKALGFIPAPIFYGKAIQTTCILSWQLSCEETGACIIYDLPQFRANFLGVSYGLQVLVSLCMCVGYFAVKRQMKDGFQTLGDVRIQRRPTLPLTDNSETSSLPTSYFTSEDIANGNGHKHDKVPL